jgi:LytS/YehU family sensor histidine kinase
MHLYNFTFNALVITIFALGLRVLERHALIEKRQKELEKEKLNSELAFLKNQISPHFFFNTLNNIYSLININAEDSQKAVLKLSKMMRYLLYESDHGENQLSHEIEFMNNYIDLMRLRMSDKVKLDVSFPAKTENISIPPLMFISVIENAFKHGISYREKSFINISMEVSSDFITFRCANSLKKAGDEISDEHSGIGLENVSKRLNLLFPGRHELKIEKTESAFEVFIKVFLGNS